MANFFYKMGRVVLAALASASLTYGTASADNAGMTAVREALTTEAKPDLRVFREQVILFSPMVTADLDFQGAGNHDKGIRLAGDLRLVATDNTGDTDQIDIPFYVEQTKKDMTIYFKSDKKWYQFKTPELSAVAVDILSTPTKEELAEEFAMVSDAEILMDDTTQRTMLVRLDSDKLADSITEYSSEDTDQNLSPEDKAFQDGFIKYLNQGIRNSDTWYTWTVDKQDWQTTTVSLDLSNILHNTAQAALSDSSKSWSPIERSLLEYMAFYADLKSYTTYLDSDVKDSIKLPKELKKAKPVDDIIPAAK